MVVSGLTRRARPLVVAGILSGALGLAQAMVPAMTATPPDFEARCRAEEPYFVTSCYLGLARAVSSRSYDDAAPSVVLFSDTPNDSPHYTLASFEQIGAIWGLAFRSVDDTVYAAFP